MLELGREGDRSTEEELRDLAWAPADGQNSCSVLRPEIDDVRISRQRMYIICNNRRPVYTKEGPNL